MLYCTWRRAVYKFFCSFRFVAKQIQYVYFECFDTFSKNGNKPKQTKKYIFGFHKTKRKTIETDNISVVFSSNRKYVLVCFEDTLSTIGFG
jgi:hypothetical protein